MALPVQGGAVRPPAALSAAAYEKMAEAVPAFCHSAGAGLFCSRGVSDGGSCVLHGRLPDGGSVLSDCGGACGVRRTGIPG